MNNFNFTGFGNIPHFPMNFSMPVFPQMSLFNFQPQMPSFFGVLPLNMPSCSNIFSFTPSLNNTFTTPPVTGNLFDSYKLPDLNLSTYTEFVPQTPVYTPIVNFNIDTFTKNSKVLNSETPKVSLTQKTDLKNVAAIYNKDKGIKLANEALAGLSSAQKGYCARAVKTAISDAGLGAYESGNANDIPDILRRNNNFKEVKVNGSDLAKLPAGCVIAYDKGAAGYSSKYGHVEIKGDGNQAISFYINNNIKPSDNVTVFVPV